LLTNCNEQPTNNVDISCVQTIGLKHVKGLFALMETNLFTFEAKCLILDNLTPTVEHKYWLCYENYFDSGESHGSLDESQMNASESDQDRSGTDEGDWASKVHEHVYMVGQYLST